ncbi:MAG TPA: hypothetical protein VGA96_14435 [Fibrella sp.]
MTTVIDARRPGAIHQAHVGLIPKDRLFKGIGDGLCRVLIQRVSFRKSKRRVIFRIGKKSG